MRADMQLTHASKKRKHIHVLHCLARFPKHKKTPARVAVRAFCCLFVLVHAVALLEAVYASTGVDQLLATREERMALGADFNLELALDGAAQKGFAACTANHGFAV